MSLNGKFQAKTGDGILGYFDTKDEAVKVAVRDAKNNALKGWSRDTKWYVGVVIDTGSNTELRSEQRSDGSGTHKDVYNTYDVVVTSVVAFGFATYDFSSRDAFGGSQGRTR